MKNLDIENWHRRSIYEHFRDYDFPHFAMTAEIDVTNLATFCDEHDLSFYRLCLYIVCRACNERQAFRLRLRKTGVVEYEEVGIAPAFGTGGGRYNFCDTPYRKDPAEFIRIYNRKEKAAAKMTHLNLKSENDDGTIFASCVPWVTISSMVNPIVQKYDATPRVSWSKYARKEGVLMMPLSLQAHHALVDGYDASCFYEKAAQMAREPELFFQTLIRKKPR
jgi:chloramphenicol O-acetyltransferase